MRGNLKRLLEVITVGGSINGTVVLASLSCWCHSVSFSIVSVSIFCP